ncbi:MAG: hypothetical protein ACRC4M_00375 [Mycoplasma sp.]
MADYYISNIQKIDSEDKTKNYIDLKLNELKIDDGYHTLWVEGKYLIKSNSVLPNYSFFLDVRTDFGEVLNVPLYFNKQVEKVMIPNSSTIRYMVDEYSFNFNLNLKNSSLFTEYIKNYKLKFEFIPMFNQEVINDFNIKVSTQNLQSFISDVNTSRDNRYVNYSNSFTISQGSNHLDFSVSPEDVQDMILVTVDKYDSTKPYLEMLRFNQLKSKLNIISGNVTLTLLDNLQSKPIDLEIKPKYVETFSHSLMLDEYVRYNPTTNDISISYENGLKGLYIPKDARVKIKLDLKIEYNRKLRTIVMDENITFNSGVVNSILGKIKQKPTGTNMEGAYSEIQSQEIYW